MAFKHLFPLARLMGGTGLTRTSQLGGSVFPRHFIAAGAAAVAPHNAATTAARMWAGGARALSGSTAIQSGGRQPSRIKAAGGSVMTAGRRTGKQFGKKVNTLSKRKPLLYLCSFVACRRSSLTTRPSVMRSVHPNAACATYAARAPAAVPHRTTTQANCCFCTFFSRPTEDVACARCAKLSRDD